MRLSKFYVDDIIKRAILEDINYIDAATDYLIDENQITTARLIAKADGVIAGIEVAKRVFELLDETSSFEILKKDGDYVVKGDIIATVKAKTSALLKGERTALNLLSHMSGIATATNKCVKLVENTKAAICETRKTLPGLRVLQKYSVTVGGGKNHRFNLSDMAMLKDNHIDAYGGIIPAVEALRSKIGHSIKIEVEVRNMTELSNAIDAKADIIMLDNMTPEQMQKAVEFVNGRAVLEASGNITEDNIEEVAKTGIDIISLGALTHSVKAFDISMVL